MKPSELDPVLSELGLPTSAKGVSTPRTLSKGRLLEIMSSGDIEVLGAVYTFIMDSKNSQRVDPPLLYDDYQRFLLNYYERCLREDPQSSWADSRYSAGWDLVNWFSYIWQDNNIPRSGVAELKQLLARLYREGDEKLRTCIVTATLEHLFEQKSIRKYFQDWRNAPVLGTAYQQAIEWVNSGQKTPLGKRRP